MSLNANTTTKIAGNNCGDLLSGLANSVLNVARTDLQLKANNAAATPTPKPEETAPEAPGVLDNIWSKIKDVNTQFNEFKSMLDSMLGISTAAQSFIKTAADPVSVFETPSRAVTGMDLTGLEKDNPTDASFMTINPLNKATETPRIPCAHDMLMGTLNAISLSASGAWNNVAAAYRGAINMFAFTGAATTDFKPALLNAPVQNLLNMFVSKRRILERIKVLVQDLVDQCQKLKDSNYGVNYISIIRSAQNKLLGSITDLTGLENRMLNGAEFDLKIWDRNQLVVKQTSSDLAKAKLAPELTAVFGALILFITEMQTYKTLLQRGQANVLSLSSVLSLFEKGSKEIKMDNVMAPFVDQLLCNLTYITRDMDATIQRNAIINFLIQIKYWGFTLNTLSKVMTAISKLSKLPFGTVNGKDLSLGTISDAMQKPFNDFTTWLEDLDKDLNGESVKFDKLVNNLNTLEKAATQKLSTNVPNAYIISISDSIIKECDEMIKKYEERSGVVEDFLGILGTEAQDAILAVAGVMEYMNDVGAEGLVNIIKGKIPEGAKTIWDALFSAKIEDVNSSFKLMTNAESARECCAANGGDSRFFSTIKDIFDLGYKDAKAQQLFADVTKKYPDSYIKKVFERDVASYKDILTGISEASRAPCIKPKELGTNYFGLLSL